MNQIKRIWNKIDKNILILLFVSGIVLLPFFNSVYLWTHDGAYHYSNIFALDQNIDFSNLKLFPDKVVPVIAENMGWGSGIFYPSLPHYFATYLYQFFKLIGITNIFTTMKICHGIVMFLSGFFMYLLSKKVFHNKKAGLVSAILYMTFPYYFIDIFVRDAFAECFLFMFLPLIFLGIEYLLDDDDKKFYLFFILGYTGAIESHLVLSIYITIFAGLYLLFHRKKIFTKSKMKALCLASIVILCLNAPFLLPLIEHTLFGDYTVYMQDHMFRIETLKETTVSILDYFSFDRPLAYTGKLVFPISLSALFCIIFILFHYKKIKNIPNLKWYLLLFLFSVLFMLPVFPWDKLPSFLWNIQFVWRLNLFLVFFMSLSAGFIINLVKEKYSNLIGIILFFSSIIYLLTLNPMLIYQDDVNSKIDVNKHGAAGYQYLPTKAYQHLDEIKNRGDKVFVKEGKAKIINLDSNTPNLTFEVKTDGCVLELPRYYYRGYEIKLNHKEIEYQENKRGLIEIKVDEGGIIQVHYEGTIWYQLSLFTLLIGILILVYLIDLNSKNERGKING